MPTHHSAGAPRSFSAPESGDKIIGGGRDGFSWGWKVLGSGSEETAAES